MSINEIVSNASHCPVCILSFECWDEVKIVKYSCFVTMFPDDHLLITSLRPNINYNVVVEARKLQKYAEMDESK